MTKTTTMALFEQAKVIYREAAYNVQRTKTQHGEGEAYSRAVCLCKDIQFLMTALGREVDGGVEAARFQLATYQPA